MASLGLKSRKLRGLVAAIDAVETPEQLADFCREHIKFLPGFDISRLNDVLDAQQFLATVPMLQHLNKRQLLEVEEAMEVSPRHLLSTPRPPACTHARTLTHMAWQVKTFPQGDYVMRQGAEDGNEMFIVAEGKCAVEIDGAVVAHKTVGQFFGEIALLRNMPRTASIRADSEGGVRLLQLVRASFDELVTICTTNHA